MQNQPARPTYAPLSIALHWVSAALILWMFYLAFGMTSDLFSNLTRRGYYELHKSTGVLLLFIGAFRLGWNLSISQPKAVTKGLKPWEIMVAEIVHKLLYFFLLFVPLSGWMLYTVAPHKAQFFGFFTIPDLFFLPGFEDASEKLREVLEGIHTTSATLLGLVLVVHIAAAIKHHFFLRNGVLVRMAPRFARPFLMRIRDKATWQDLGEKLSKFKPK